MVQERHVIKHSSATQIGNTISLMARKTYNILLWKSYPDLKHKDTFEIREADLLKGLDTNSKNVEHLHLTLKSLVSTPIQFNNLGKTKRWWSEYQMMPLLSWLKVSKGRIQYAYSPQLQELLRNKDMYARLSLQISNKFKSKAGLALWELCKDYHNEQRETSYTPRMTPPKLRDLLLGNEKSYLNNFKEFNRYIIKRAIKEVNDQDPIIEIKPVYERSGKLVITIQFKIRKKQKYPNSPSVFSNQSNQKSNEAMPIKGLDDLKEQIKQKGII